MHKENKKEILVISYCIPYDNVSHAGGKTHNFYLKNINKYNDFKIKLISFGLESDRDKADTRKYGIPSHVYYIGNSKTDALKRGLLNLTNKYNPYDKHGNMLPGFYTHFVKRELVRLSKKGYKPDIIILEWTQMVFMAEMIKKIYPDCKIIASEHDVSYLGFERKIDFAEDAKEKKKMERFYRNVKREELKALGYCDMVFPHNNKDGRLLINDGIDEEKIHPIVAYFDDYSQIERKPDGKTVTFYGAMSRPENYLSAIWFIENVLERMEDGIINFVILGSKPAKELADVVEKYNQSHNTPIELTGFVEDITPYFEKTTCLVAPLVLGAGIKVKIIEALSAGMPVLTNELGIEGIDAVDGKDFLYCQAPEDYIEKLKSMMAGEISVVELGENARKFIKRQFNLQESLEDYIKVLRNITGK